MPDLDRTIPYDESEEDLHNIPYAQKTLKPIVNKLVYTEPKLQERREVDSIPSY